MIRLTIDPASMLVHHEGIPEGMTLHLDPRAGGLVLKLESIENMSARDERERYRDRTIMQSIELITSGIAGKFGMKAQPCEDCAEKQPTFSSHPTEFTVRLPDGLTATLQPGIYRWKNGIPEFVSNPAAEETTNEAAGGDADKLGF